MSEPREQIGIAASSVAWDWRQRAAGDERARAREATANRRKGWIGALVGVAFAALAYYLDRPVAALVIAGIAIAVALIAVVSPLGLFKALSRGLDRFAHAVGSGVTWVLMPILFYLVFLPVGLFLRARGRLAISRHADRRLPTYWKPTGERARTSDSYRKQF